MTIIEDKLKYILPNVNKPSRYIGEELGAIHKDFDKVDVNFALVFPDMYELGICNLGCRILYDILNKQDFIWAQRAYAPDVDMKKEMENNNIPLYAVESKTPLNKFDIVAFSMQYELAYPTILAMLKLSDIPIKNLDRKETDPIVVGGGPCAYNPLPMTSFIDVFNIGDGEETLIEMSQCLKNSKDKTRDEKLKALANIQGVFVPKYPKSKIKKRLCDLNKVNAIVDFPIPYSPCVHDRVVTEIRRGCGRMCRFCQSCFTNLPIRERDAKEVVETTNQLLENTGYEEYSLLSLSSNDYSNIEPVVEDLCNIHSKTGASISLPSQRADSFSLNLANMVQSVRKSTMTFAPEAGSQRLRNVINKNLTEEQIIDAVMTCYKAGWGKIKLYFMIGLPTETFEDLDAMIKLLGNIKRQGAELKKELSIKQHLDLTCTISNFVPKPHTPFQWCAQDTPEIFQQKISYLLEKKKPLKGVRLNFSDIFLSQLEAVFAKGDERLNILIEKMYEKGAYLDAWREYFDKDLWQVGAKEVDLDYESIASKEFALDEELVWDFIDTGVEKKWLVNEYNQSLKDAVSFPCDDKCTACGACSNTGKIKSLYEQNSYKVSQRLTDNKPEETYSYRLVISKKGALKYISHLDWLGTFYKSLRRAKLDLVFSQGFNPSPKISASIALPIFVESEGEYLDIEIYNNFDVKELQKLLNAVMPYGAEVLQVFKINKETKSIDKIAFWAKYSASPIDKELVKSLGLRYKVDELLNKDEFLIEKTNKKGLTKTINIRESIKSIEIIDEEKGKLEFILKTGQLGSDKIKQLRADEFLNNLFGQTSWEITRESVLDENLKELLQVL